MKPQIQFSRLPEAYHLTTVNWQLFGTITMRNKSRSRRQILAKLIATIRQTCRVSCRKDAEQIMLFCRFDKGADSLHAHFLMAGIPEHLAPHRFGYDFKNRWQRRAGNCKVDPYDSARDGVGYVTKCSSEDDDRDLAQPYFSPALIQHLKGSVADIISR
jgi:hypothetical protein